MFHILIEAGLIVSGGFAGYQIVATIDRAMPRIAGALAGRSIDRPELPAPARQRKMRSATRLRWHASPAEASASARRA